MLSDWFHEWWITFYFFLLRPMFKWLLRQITGKCELLRITYDETDGAERVKRIENSLKHSRTAELKECVSSTEFNVDLSVRKIVAIKNVIPEIHSQFESCLRDCLLRIRAYNKILADAEALRKTRYSKDNSAHEAKLVELWNAYNQGRRLPDRIGEHWTDLGFQGTDPSTDFRGMGMLGLEQLLYFATTYPDQAKHVLSQSHHPQFGFSFAIVGINITEMGCTMLSKRKLRSHFYSLEKQEPNLEDFHKVYCHLLYDFVQFWVAEKPKDIMEFNRVREKYRKTVQRSLKQPKTRLLSPFQEQEQSS